MFFVFNNVFHRPIEPSMKRSFAYCAAFYLAHFAAKGQAAVGVYKHLQRTAKIISDQAAEVVYFPGALRAH